MTDDPLTWFSDLTPDSKLSVSINRGGFLDWSVAEVRDFFRSNKQAQLRVVNRLTKPWIIVITTRK